MELHGDTKANALYFSDITSLGILLRGKNPLDQLNVCMVLHFHKTAAFDFKYRPLLHFRSCQWNLELFSDKLKENKQLNPYHSPPSRAIFQFLELGIIK